MLTIRVGHHIVVLKRRFHESPIRVKMPNRAVSTLLVFLTLLTSMGESLHGLPIFDHHGREQCQSDGLHFDNTLESSDVECPICEILTQFQAMYDSQSSLVCYESGEYFKSLLIINFDASDCFRSRSRAPPMEFIV